MNETSRKQLKSIKSSKTSFEAMININMHNVSDYTLRMSAIQYAHTTGKTVKRFM